METEVDFGSLLSVAANCVICIAILLLYCVQLCGV